MIHDLIPGIILCLIPIVAIIMVFGTGMLAIFFSYQKRKHIHSLYHQERMAAIEKGIELPPLPDEFFDEEGGGKSKPRAPRGSHGTLLAGLILVAISLTLFLALHSTVPRLDNGGNVAWYALIPGGIGAACLIYYFAVGRRAAAAIEAERAEQLAAKKTK